MVGKRWRSLAVGAVCASALVVGACGGNDTGATDTAVAGGDVARADSAAAVPAPGTVAPSPSGTATMAITGGDPEVLQVLATVDQSEIAAGRAAQNQARHAQVKAFARTLVNEHTQSLRQERQIARTANIPLDTMAMGGTATTPAPGSTATPATPSATPGASTSAVVTQLHTMHQQTMDRLRSLQGADFDSAFMNAQIATHQQVLDLLQRAQGQAQNASLQQHLTTATQGVQKHLERAQQIQQTLMSGGAAGDSASKAKGDTARRG